jgi:5-methylcytosine-specific restriction endonuclease McrA
LFKLPYRNLGWLPIGQIEFSAGFRFNPDRDERPFSNEEPFMHRPIHKFRLLRYRQQAFKRQKGRCYYCGVPMWSGRADEFAGNYGIRESQVKHFRCTAEHLIARQDGGTDDRENIVAACLYCNLTRHQVLEALPPNEYRKHVLSLVQRQKWHPIECHHML